MPQEYPGLLYFKKWISDIFRSIFVDHTFRVEMWSLSMGLGQDVFGNAIDFRLPDFLYALFPAGGTELFLIVYTQVYMVLAGEAFILYVRKIGARSTGAVIGAFIYIFCGYTLYFSVKHTFFLEMMICFPLMLTGIETVFRKKVSYLFILTVFLSGLSYFYFLYMITLPAMIYALFRFFDQEKHGWKEFFRTIGRFAWQYVLGLMLAAVSLVPMLVKVLQSGRTGGSSGNHILLWEKEYYVAFLKSIFDTNVVPNLGCLTIAALGLIAVVYLVFSRDKKSWKILAQIAIYFVVLLLPPLSLLFCAYTGRAQRWSFVLNFWIAVAFTAMLPRMLEKKERRLYIKVLVSICCSWLAAAVLYFLYKQKLMPVLEKTVEKNAVWIFVFLAILALYHFTTLFGKKHHRSVIVGLLVVCMLAEAGVKSFQLYSPDKGNYISEFVDAGKLEARGSDNAAFMVTSHGDDSVYRSDVVVSPINEKYNQNNYGLRSGLNGLANYYSFTNGRISQYSIDMGNSQQNVSFLNLDLDQRTGLDALASVKYVASTDVSNYKIPYGYSLIETGKKIFSDGREETSYLYENDHYLPLMYAYDSWIDAETYKALEVNEREQAMLQGVVLEEEIDYPETQIQFDCETLMDWEDIRAYVEETQPNDSAFVIEPWGVTVKSYTSFSLPIPYVKGELYVRLNDMEYVSENVNNAKGWKPTDVSWMDAYLNGRNDTCTLTNSTYEYYMGKRDLLLNLGYVETDGVLNLSFGALGEYHFSDISILCQPMESYPSRIEALTQTPVTNITLGTNEVTGTVRTEETKLVCAAVPYSEGWRAYVNGEETKIYPANEMYMAVMAPAGESEICFRYHTPGSQMGVAITCGGVFLLVVCLIVERKVYRAPKARRSND